MPKAKKKTRLQPERIAVPGMHYAPTNELGVVYLFALLAPRLGFKGIEKIQSGFPDCTARRRTGDGDKLVRIEFEYRSSSFRAHRHDAKQCDCVVCWVHDWPDVPRRVEIIELRSKVGLGRDVWIQPIDDRYWDELDAGWTRGHWSVPSLAKPGDLVLMYRTRPCKCIQDIFVLDDRVRKDLQWHYMADVRRVARMKSPLTLEHMRLSRVVGSASFIRRSMQGRPRVTEYWPFLYDLIVKLNPALESKLRRYAPQLL